MQITRRHFLTKSTALGCSLAASPLITPVTFASTPGENRLIVIILRGGLDGLDAVRPVGDPDFATLRPDRARDTRTHDLGGLFALHPAFGPLMPLWTRGELGFVHAVSTPYRDKRSHFDGQDLLEAGTGPDALGRIRDGWLNRMLQHMPDVTTQTAYAVDRADMLLTRGTAPVANWSPDAALTLSPQAQLLLEKVMHADPLFRDATLEAIALSTTDLSQTGMTAGITEGDMLNAMQQNVATSRKPPSHQAIAAFAARKLRDDARIAAFSLNGWDTHRNQHKSLPKSLGQLSETILALRDGLGPAWGTTTVVAVTEFGRTARLNGTAGTDHGTGGAMVLAGGALKGGHVWTDWPGLSEAALYGRRDLNPTRDLRAYLGWLMRPLFGIETSTLERTIFPGVDLGEDPGLIL